MIEASVVSCGGFPYRIGKTYCNVGKTPRRGMSEGSIFAIVKMKQLIV